MFYQPRRRTRSAGCCVVVLPKTQSRDCATLVKLESRLRVFSPASLTNPTELATRKQSLPLRKILLWVAGIVLAFIAGGLGVWLQRPVSSELPLRKLELQISGLDLSLYDRYSISPNAKSIAYVSNNRLWIRDLDRLEPREVPNTENASHPFWSPDSSYVGYVIGKKMWKVSSARRGDYGHN